MLSVIFDMDGTLIDTQREYIRAWNHAGELCGFSNMAKHIPEIAGMTREKWGRYLLTIYPTLDVKKFVEEEDKYMAEHLVPAYMPGAKEMLDFLKEKGVKMALASGTSKPSILKLLRAVEATEYFGAIVSGHEVENSKPFPDVFLRAAELIGAKPEDCIVFEDSGNGVKAAYAAGMKCIGVPDVAPFTPEIKKMLYKEFTSLFEAKEFIKELF